MRMLKVIVGVLLLVAGSCCFADNIPTNSCLSKTAQLQSWSAVPISVSNCMNRAPEFVKAISYVCANDQVELSNRYKKYLSAKEVYEKAWKKYYAAKDAGTRALAALDMQNAEEDWSLSGFRAEIDAALNTINQVHFQCSPQ